MAWVRETMERLRGPDGGSTTRDSQPPAKAVPQPTTSAPPVAQPPPHPLRSPGHLLSPRLLSPLRRPRQWMCHLIRHGIAWREPRSVRRVTLRVRRRKEWPPHRQSQRGGARPGLRQASRRLNHWDEPLDAPSRMKAASRSWASKRIGTLYGVPASVCACIANRAAKPGRAGGDIRAC